MTTVETVSIPNDILVVCFGKSTYARSGIEINVTPIEPGFKGQIVVEIANATPNKVCLYPYEGIFQGIFLAGDRSCSVSYEDRGGKYQEQKGMKFSQV